MKVLITTDCYFPTVNGVVTSVENLRTVLEDIGCEVHILTLSKTMLSHEKNGVYYLGSFSAEKIYPDARLSLFIRNDTIIEELVSWKPDIVHSQTEFSVFLAAQHIASLTGAPIIHTYHTLYEDYTHYFSPNRFTGRKIAGLFSRAVISHTSAVIAPTEKVRNILARYRVKVPVVVIPTGIDLSTYREAVTPDEIRAHRFVLGIPEENRIMLYAGRLAREKNIDELIECRRRLCGNITLLIAGDGPDRARLVNLASEYGMTEDGKVVFCGMIPHENMPVYYHLADVFVSASSSETQGLTYIESLASGVPVFCRKDESADGIIMNGLNGAQFTSVCDLAQRLSVLFDDRKVLDMLSQNTGLYSFRFSREQFGKNVLELYQKVLENRTLKSSHRFISCLNIFRSIHAYIRQIFCRKEIMQYE